MPLVSKTTQDGLFTISLEWDDETEHYSEESLRNLAELFMFFSTDLTTWIDKLGGPKIQLES